MRDMAGKVAVSRGLVGLAVAAGVGYCAYRYLARAERRKPVSGGSLAEKVASLTVRPAGPSGAAFQSENISNSASNLELRHLRALLENLEADTANSSFQEQILITLGNSAAFSSTHDIIRSLNGIQIIGTFLSDPNPKLKEKALNALNNLSMNLKNQEQIQDFLPDVCNEIASSPLNSELQLAGLRLAINMSVTNNYHNLLEDSIPTFLTLLEEGDKVTQIHTLKVLVNLSANPSMTTALLCSRASLALMALFGSSTDTDVLLRALTFAANLSDNLTRAQLHDCDNYSLYALLFRDQTAFQENLAALLHHPDPSVKELVARLLCPSR